jgi:radical SAM superfamily enzyme YgiQ (UPF0313 family)
MTLDGRTVITGPIRPPSEAFSLLIRVTENCPWNRCEFCSVFKGQKFAIRPVDEVKEDILAARQVADQLISWARLNSISVTEAARANNILWLSDTGVTSAFLQDSDTMIMKTDPLVEVVTFLKQTFPELDRICSYARGKTLCHKTLDELKRIRAAGLSRVHIGLETGDDELLAYIQKGATYADMIEGGRRAVEAGFEVSEYVMPGLGGRERWEQHVRGTARVLNAVNPHFIRLRSFHVLPGSRMYEKAVRAEYHVQSIEGALREVRALVEQLDVESQIVTSDYAWNYFMGDIDGKLPADRQKLLKAFDDAIAFWRRRGEPERSPFFAPPRHPEN